MDVLSDLLETIRLNGAVFFRAAFSAPWTVRSERAERLQTLLAQSGETTAQRRLILFHFIAAGSCWAEANGKRSELASGDVIVFPYGDEHVMGQGQSGATQDIASLFPSPPPWPAPPCLTTGGGGDETHIVCGFLSCDQALFNPLFDVLPAMLVVRPRDETRARLLRSSLDFLSAELERPAPGVESVTRRLTELLFVEVVRQHASELAENQLGWLAALRDDAIRRALEAIHARPQEDWSVDDLAKRAAMSRSAFYERFAQLVGEPPAQYLTRWRLQRAAHLLLSSELPLAAIAESVGYGSETALVRAFKRTSGQSPAAFRKQRR
ncbi:MAG TPA: AraC family transcriptional regulator [Polyangiaceae bacterium]|nr:AraC family transcriptional regulator [Polyangiaceae bacterium]